MSALRTGSLIGAIVTMGLTAGLFWAFAYSVMNALASVDDRTFVDVFNKINIAILNPWFAFCFGGGLVFAIIAALTHLGADHRTVLLWVAVAGAFYVVALAITMGINVPLNDRLARVDPTESAATLAAARQDFESSWVRWNIVRAGVHTAAFGVMCWALYQAGRHTADLTAVGVSGHVAATADLG
ncbi:DUF1772 domain-containing protein [Aldersonia sp. NBC_00410]|uniref:anthrone oxygenase family protein n=1 Tax=Aldersonia sp. NBC_00410 TaxID=2975954 RepID=UPI00224D2779|nr:anthrone oxygenase family protein [Aldersonia sp. NBC_00410]MCX5043487.1 DUF1772 domain-containing protein [Aldersonia sp. NBC_00410]